METSFVSPGSERRRSPWKNLAHRSVLWWRRLRVSRNSKDGVFAALCEFGRRETAAALAARDDELRAKAPPGWRVKDRRVRAILTRYGPVEVLRRRYVDGSGATRYLLDESLDLEKRSRVSPSLERLLVTLAADISFRDAARTVSAAVGAHVGHTTAHGRLGRTGKRLAAQGAAASSDLLDLGLDPGGEKDAASLSCEADGTVIALQGSGCRRRGEVKLAVFYTDKQQGLGAVHAGFQAASDFWGEAAALAGSHYDLSSVRACIVAGDGARWVRGGLDVLPHSRFQLDPFRIRRAILRASRDHPFSSRVFSALYSGGLGAADALLSGFKTGHPERTEDIEGVRRYLSSNADGLWRSDPGLGTIEGHIDKILANRMKKRGRRWSPKGADAMARIVSHKTGESFTRTLRDISGARKADY